MENTEIPRIVSPYALAIDVADVIGKLAGPSYEHLAFDALRHAAARLGVVSIALHTLVGREMALAAMCELADVEYSVADGMVTEFVGTSEFDKNVSVALAAMGY